MTTTTNLQDLSLRIEQVVHEHIAASQTVASAAVERSFGTAAGKTGKTPPASRPRKSVRRRSRDEMAALGEQLYQAVCAKPGEGMVALAADVGAIPRELNRPMAQLKDAGKVRSVGQRHLTRYFPLVGESIESA